MTLSTLLFCGLATVTEAALEVPLHVDVAPGAKAPDGWPVTTGVPFKDGRLVSPEGLRLETDDGRAVPAQFNVRGRWPRSGDVRWLGVDFQLTPGVKQYRLKSGAPAAPAHSAPIRVEKTPQSIVVTSGSLKAEIPRGGGMLHRVRLDGTLVVEQGTNDGNWFTTLQGQRFSERGARATIELEGPLHTVVRVDGVYANASGERSCRWTARLHFFAGRPFIKIVHTFTWIGLAEDLQIRDLAISFGLKSPATVAIADRSDRPADGAIARHLTPGQSLAIVQDEHWHWGHGKSHFGILYGDAGKPNEIVTGERAGGWVTASSEQGGVTLAMRDLWQQYPKELRVAPERVTAFLWTSSANAAPFDLRFDALERYWGPYVKEELSGQRWQKLYHMFKNDPLRRNPTGMAKTHDLLLVFHKGHVSGDTTAELADAFEGRMLVCPDPEWTYESGVVGRLAPVDAETFPELEAAAKSVWDQITKLADDWGDYGFFSYGAGPHQTYKQWVDGRPKATVWRYTTGVEYGFGVAAWLGWLRSGDRHYFERADAHSRYLNDVMLCHETNPSRLKGDWAWYPGLDIIPWGGRFEGERAEKPDNEAVPPVIGQFRSFGFFIEHAALQYYLSGDERVNEVIGEYAATLKAFISAQEDWAKTVLGTVNVSGSRWIAQRMDELAVLYLHTADGVNS